MPTTEAGICRVQLAITEGTCNSSAFEGENCQPAISGGNGPFTYTSSNLTNGATINASTGQLNPDAKTGPTTVTVTDSLGQVASVTLSNIKPLYRNCKEIIQARPSELNQHKTYDIDEDGIRTGLAKTVLMCEHIADGGGWTRLYSGHGNPASNTISSQFVSSLVFNAATEIMVYYADSNQNQLTTKYKFSKPANFNLWSVRNGTHLTTVHNLNNGTSVLGVVRYGHENWSTICDVPYGATNNYYGRFGLCDQGTSAISNPNFGQFPQYTHQSTAGTDNCSTMDSANYSNPSCSSNRALVIFAR